MKVIQSVNFVTLMYSILQENTFWGLARRNTDSLDLCSDAIF